MAEPAEPVGPTIHPTAVLAPGALCIGQVTIEEDCFIGPNAVLRGDIEAITVRRGANIQDNCVVHTERDHPVDIGEGASIGHGAIVHGATVGKRAIVGMNAVVLDLAVVGERSIVAAGAVVPAGFHIPDRSLAAGVPCKILKENDREVADKAYQNGQRYLRYRKEHLSGMWKTVSGPLNDNGSFSR